MIHKTMLVILDGVGDYIDYEGNAVKRASMPFLSNLYDAYPWTLIETSGNAAGLPDGVQGASEPGHLTMGAGRIVWQPFEEINQSISRKEFNNKKEFVDCFDFVKKNTGTLHLFGLISDGGVHSHLSHLYALLTAAKEHGITNVMIHGITDGRDVPEQSAMQYVEELEKNMKAIGVGKLATLIGRFDAMDRDKNYDRTKVFYDLLIEGKGDYFATAREGLDHFYSHTEKELQTDYYLTPMKLINEDAFVKKGDGIIFFNFRSDRSAQITESFASTAFSGFQTKEDVTVPHISFVCMGPYSSTLPIAFPPNEVKNNVGSWISQQGLTQLRIAETEKYAHVTFFFNSQIHEPYDGEDRILVPSPKVASYAEKPEMSAPEVTEKLIDALQNKAYDFIAVNFANGDLVGHSGNFEAVRKAMETIDICLLKMIPVAQEKGYNIIITADHGNSEYMINPDGSQNPSHTIFPVRALIITEQKKNIVLKNGLGISSLGTTALKLMNIDLAPEMTAETLF